MSEEERIRELCARVVNADARNRPMAVEDLRTAIRNYLSLHSDPNATSDVLRMPHTSTPREKKRAA
jgi:hypothetical protein